MDKILIPVLIVAGIGLLAGIILAVVSAIMAVPKDEKAEAILEVLPGANCGACGFPAAPAMRRRSLRAKRSPGCVLPAAKRAPKRAQSCLARATLPSRKNGACPLYGQL